MTTGQGAFSESVSNLTPKVKPPASARVLDGWVNQAQTNLGVDAAGGRLGWLIASTVVVAALQRAVDVAGPLFLLKGGTLLQHRLGLDSRATRDIDGLVRGDLSRFLVTLDDVIKQPWGHFASNVVPPRSSEHPPESSNRCGSSSRSESERRSGAPSRSRSHLTKGARGTSPRL